MKKIYEQINEKEILCKDITLPENFPAIYIDEYDNIYCYNGVVDKNRFLFNSSPYYLKNQKPNDIKDSIRGYFRIENGTILYDKEFINEKNSFNKQLKCKIIPAHPRFPAPNDMSFGIFSQKYNHLEEEISRHIFGLSYNELKELLYHYNEVFQIAPISIYSRYPSITRSIKNNNYCDINDLWIPAGFPYIAFCESDYYYSHVSFSGFYQNVQFITSNDINSQLSKLLISNGLNPEILKKLFKIDNMSYSSIPINSYLYRELNNFYN